MDCIAEFPLLPAVSRFLEIEGGERTDYSGCIILVPHHHTGRDFRRALRHALRSPVILPPRLLTLPDLAQAAELAPVAEPSCKRLAELHEFLRKTGHIPAGMLWPSAQELAALLEEMDAAQAGLHDDALRRALGRLGDNPYLGLEATIARNVWDAMRQGAPGRMLAYGSRLAWLAEHAGQPVYTLGLVGLSVQEQAFLRSWGSRQPVHELPAPVRFPERQALFNLAWRATDPPLGRRAEAYAKSCPESPLMDRLAIHPAHNLESAAQLAEHILLGWLGEGRRHIALVALDRLLARRLRALLERRAILIQDETGWAFSTSAVSHVLERWLGLAGGPIWHRDLLDLLKSPFVFSDAPVARLQTAHGLESALRRHGAPSDLAGYKTLARQEHLPEALSILQRLEIAKGLFSPRRRSLGEWTRALLSSLDHLGAGPAMAADPIGRQLLDLLSRLALEVDGLTQGFTLSDWRRWLFLHLEGATFSDTSVESPIRLTHLAATHHRDLEGVLILGAGAAHLPGGGKAALFNDAILRQLGLPAREDKEGVVQDMVIDLLCRVPTAALIWQSEAEGDPAPLSPWLTHLDAFHQAAWHQSLLQPLPLPHPHPSCAGGPTPPAPRAPQPPGRLSVSAWQSLVACPYQFFARHILGLNEQDEFPEEMDKAEYGSLVHRILARFHLEHPSLAGESATHWVSELATISAAVFAAAEQRNFQATAWHLRWERHIPDYVDWAMGHEASGWHFQSAEVPLEKAVAWGEDEATRLYGRADRLDRNGDRLAVLDYKTQSRQTLRAKLDPDGEDVQLAAYAWLAGADEAGFLTVDEKQVALLQAEGGDSLAAWAAAEAERIALTMDAMASGHPLPAHGAPPTCAWCEMAGLCRRAHRADVET